MLAKLVNEKMKKDELSLRDAGLRIGTSHTTITRIRENKQIDIETLNKVCTWLNISLADVIKDQYKNDDKMDKFLIRWTLLINSNQKLAARVE